MAKRTVPKPIIKSLSFKYKNYDCYEYIKDMSNFSDYICDLIRLDMEYDLLRNIHKLPESIVNEIKSKDNQGEIKLPNKEEEIPEIATKQNQIDKKDLNTYTNF